jgi:hypothetical protein
MIIWRIKNYFYYVCERYGDKVSKWGWHKRWNRRNYEPNKHYFKGEKK